MKNTNTDLKIDQPQRLSSYFKKEWFVLIVITISGIIYNIGMTAGPYFEGQLVQRLFDIIEKKKQPSDMFILAAAYIVVIFLVQGMRCIKRFYTRRFANNTSRNMRHMVYNSLVFKNRQEIEQENIGSMMTRAIVDVDACAEGMRKVTTEIFDTGIVLIAYIFMLLSLDWRLTLVSGIFVPIAYVLADKLKKAVYHYNTLYKKSSGHLNSATLDRVDAAITYRVFGTEQERNQNYEKYLKDYEKNAVMANIWGNTLQPLYQILSMTGVIFIIYFGGKNVCGNGWTAWNLASFTTFLSCFTKMAVKASKSANLFNAVQKAQVSWRRIKPYMKEYHNLNTDTQMEFDQGKELVVTNLGFSYPGLKAAFDKLSLHAKPGDVIGVAGVVASGKSTFGKCFLSGYPYEGSIKIGNQELQTVTEYEKSRLVTYMGHQPELMIDSIEENVCLGDLVDVKKILKTVCLYDEVKQMPESLQTFCKDGGVRLSGGQQDRLALARTLAHPAPVMILDDPFSAVDKKTEKEIMEQMKVLLKDKIIILISHRFYLFPEFDQIIWFENGEVTVSTHKKLLKENSSYREMFMMQHAGGDLDEE